MGDGLYRSDRRPGPGGLLDAPLLPDYRGGCLSNVVPARMAGWKEVSGIAVEVGTFLTAGEPFVYAYYDGLDKPLLGACAGP